MADPYRARVLADVERTLAIVQATIDHLPASAITRLRLGWVSQLEATRARLQHELGAPPAWPTGSTPFATLPIGGAQLLFLPAGPRVQAAIDDEVRMIARALAPHDRIGIVNLADAAPDQLLPIIAGDRARVLHMSGRGRDDTIVLHGDDGLDTAVSSGPLTTIVRDLGRELRLVVLHERGSRALAPALAELVPCVIAVDDRLGATTARLFFEALYRGLAAGGSVRRGFDDGCRALTLLAVDAARLPVLIERLAPVVID